MLRHVLRKQRLARTHRDGEGRAAVERDALETAHHRLRVPDGARQPQQLLLVVDEIDGARLGAHGRHRLRDSDLGDFSHGPRSGKLVRHLLCSAERIVRPLQATQELGATRAFTFTLAFTLMFTFTFTFTFGVAFFTRDR